MCALNAAAHTEANHPKCHIINGGFPHDAQIFTIWRTFQCIILMIITCSGGVFHILFTDYTRNTYTQQQPRATMAVAAVANNIMSQPVTRPIIKCTYLSVMCQLMPRAHGFYHFPVNIGQRASAHTPTVVCVCVRLAAARRDERPTTACDTRYIMQYYRGLLRCEK